MNDPAQAVTTELAMERIVAATSTLLAAAIRRLGHRSPIVSQMADAHRHFVIAHLAMVSGTALLEAAHHSLRERRRPRTP